MFKPALPIATLLLIAPATATASETIAFSYDARGRLTGAARSGSVNAGVTTAYAYDAAANRTQVTTTGASGAAPPLSPATAQVAVVHIGGSYRIIRIIR